MKRRLVCGVCRSLPIVEDLKVVEDRVGQREPGVPSIPVQQLNLHPGPEGFHPAVVVAVANGPHRLHEAGIEGAPGVRPRGVSSPWVLWSLWITTASACRFSMAIPSGRPHRAALVEQVEELDLLDWCTSVQASPLPVRCCNDY